MPEGMKDRQSTDSAQGGEGTQSMHRKGWDPMLKNINEGRGVEADVGHERMPAIDQGTK